MKKFSYCFFVFVLIALLYVLACESGKTQPVLSGSNIPLDPTVLAPSDLENPPDPLVLAHAGRLYDKWWVEAGIEEPTDDNPLWSLQSFNTRSGSDTWRCNECHGWDYRGQGGAYSSGSHFTGFPSIYGALSIPPWNAACADVSFEHDFRVLGDAHLGHCGFC